MATYIELSRRDQITTIVTTQYTLSDGSVIVVDVPIFMPTGEDDIKLGLTNRGVTEDYKLENNV